MNAQNAISRWKDGDAVKRIPHNVLRHFPVIPRLLRLCHDAETREDVLWHSRNQEYRYQNVMCHPSHGSEWKSFNHKHKKFDADPRNIRLGLALDGFVIAWILPFSLFFDFLGFLI